MEALMKQLANGIIIVVAIVLAFLCSPPLAQAIEDSALMMALKNFQGEYERMPNGEGYVFNRKQELEAIVSSGAFDQTIQALVACLDKVTPSKVTLEGKRLPVGVVCYEGLALLIYYEPTTSTGDIALKWPG